jgi:hypothetical protein
MGIGKGMTHDKLHAAARSSLSLPRITILSASTGKGRLAASVAN